ncbi:MAG: EFR1 family ferrodoxin [Proteobacteria bacterium]|nr:EFR1 family ferrodoxin [Pseudomonadota bacterium]MBU1583315.1 EFR1 family ferrodoxin [Pseudomonadota bacterium]MBU2454631.1 EFR1 family ferrodoxin [Pseudomonadota bacterium]MBU2629574.1 EFR1 family ferrodoxin [Pseudomonadota bacterium]
MKASMMTFSQTGNTLKVGDSIKSGLRDYGFEVDHVRFLHRKKWNPQTADLIGIGCPVFENLPAECVLEFLKKSACHFKGKKTFVYITSGGSPAKSLWHLAQAVLQTGAGVIGGLQLRGAVTVPTKFGEFIGRPDSRDLEHAHDFGHAVAKGFLYNSTLPDHFRVSPDIGGKFYNSIGPWLTYLKKKTTPIPKWDAQKCNFCGNCAYECPTDTITIQNKSIHFGNTCMVCYRCWHVCSQGAVSIRFSPGNGFIERSLYANRMERYFGNIGKDEIIGTNLYKDVLARKIRLKYDRKHPTAEFDDVR